MRTGQPGGREEQLALCCGWPVNNNADPDKADPGKGDLRKAGKNRIIAVQSPSSAVSTLAATTAGAITIPTNASAIRMSCMIGLPGALDRIPPRSGAYTAGVLLPCPHPNHRHLNHILKSHKQREVTRTEWYWDVPESGTRLGKGRGFFSVCGSRTPDAGDAAQDATAPETAAWGAADRDAVCFLAARRLSFPSATSIPATPGSRVG